MVIADAYAPGTTFIPEMDSRVMMQPYLLIDSDEGRTPLIPFSIAASVESARTGGAASLGVAPNPSRGDAAVTYTLPRRGPAVLSIYDMLGRPAARIDLGTHDAGTYTATVPAGGLPAGVYNMVLDGAATARTKLVILR